MSHPLCDSLQDVPHRPLCSLRTLGRAATLAGSLAILQGLSATVSPGFAALGSVTDSRWASSSGKSSHRRALRRRSSSFWPLRAEGLGRGAAAASPASSDTAGDVELVQLQSMALQGLSEEAEDILYDLIDKGVQLRMDHFTAIFDACATNQDLDRAERWLFRMQALQVMPDIATYNSLIHVAGEARSWEMANRWFTEVQEAGLIPDLQTHRAMLHVLRQVGFVAGIEGWFEKMMETGIQPDIKCCNSVVGIFADSRQMRKVEEWLAITEQRLGIPLNVDSYNIAMRGYLAEGDVRSAERLMEVMVDKGVQPNTESFTQLIGDREARRESSFVHRWTKRLQESGVELSARAYSAAVGAFAASGDTASAERWFARMMDEGKQTADTLALLVDAFVVFRGNKGAELAKGWVNKMRQEGSSLTPAVYAALASADVLRGDFEQVEARMQQMEADGLQMDESSLTALLLAYANAEPQQSQLAEQMFKQQILGGRIQATHDVLQALRAAVGGARCLFLRRDLQLGKALVVEKKERRVWKVLRQEPTGLGNEWAGIAVPPPDLAAKQLAWE
mmetsp:Transcript_28799/g.67100  ORF Transcript_28799/g.67100 Transcript_28799/m.67100 type:complete len:564 (-) Transcript_28799:132-1823(-)